MILQKIYLVSPGVYGGADMIGIEGVLYKNGNQVATLPYFRKDFEPNIETDIWTAVNVPGLATADADIAMIIIRNVEAPAVLYFLGIDGRVISQEIARQVVGSPEFTNGEQYIIALEVVPEPEPEPEPEPLPIGAIVVGVLAGLAGIAGIAMVVVAARRK